MTKILDPMTAPLGEVLDWLAERDGWARTGYGDTWTGKGKFSTHHPITLDRVAGMLPEGYGWTVEQDGIGTCASAVWVGNPDNDKDNPSVFQVGKNELEARARVVAAVLMREAAR